MKGFILLFRSIYDCWVWDKAIYSQRWIDFIMQATWKDKEVFFHGVEFDLKRGQFVTSQRILSDRWHTNNKQVKTFLSRLIKDDMIVIERRKKFMVITLCNYNKFQSVLLPQIDDDFEPGSGVISEQKTSETSTKTQQQGATSRSRKKSIEQIINKKNNKPKKTLSEQTREQSFLEEVFKSDKLERGCAALGVTEDVFREIAQLVVNDWIFNEEEHWDFKHLLNTMRIKISVRDNDKQKQKANGKPGSENRSTDGRGESGGPSGENPLNRAKVHRSRAKESGVDC